jgi:hypothetical protein
MEGFLRKFTQLNGVEAKIIIDHYLFDQQTFYCDELQTINDDERIGVMIKKREIYMYKQDVKVAEVNYGIHKISDGKLTLTIIVNKM